MGEIFLCDYFFRYCYSDQHCLTVQLPTDPARKKIHHYAIEGSVKDFFLLKMRFGFEG